MAAISIVRTSPSIKRYALAAACVLGMADLVSSAEQTAAQTVPSTVHYQADIVLTCNDQFCSGSFAKPGANRQINVTRISCFLYSSASGATYFSGALSVDNAKGAIGPRQFLPIDYSNEHGAFIIDRPADLLIVDRQHLHVGLSMLIGAPTQAECTATGTLTTLG